MIDVPSGTEKPAFSAIHSGLWPTTVGLSLASPQLVPLAWTPKMSSSSIAFSAAFTR